MKKLEELNKSYCGPRVSDGAGVFVAGFIFMYIFQAIAVIVALFFKFDIDNAPVWFDWIMLTINCLAFVVAMVAYGKVTNKPLLKECKIDRRVGWRPLAIIPAIILASILAFLPLAEGFVKLVTLITKKPPQVSLGIGEKWWEILLSIFFLSVIPAFGEELLFRGGVARGLKRKNYVFGLLMTGLLFSIFHGSATQTVHQFLVGIVFTFIYYATGSLLASMFAHFLNNFVAIMLELTLSKINVTITTGGVIAIYVVMCIVGFVLLYFLLRYFMKVCKADKGLAQNTDKMAWAKDLGKAFTISGIKDNYNRLNTSLKALFDDSCDNINIDGDVIKDTLAMQTNNDSSDVVNETNQENNSTAPLNEMDKLLEESNRQTIAKRKRFDIYSLVVAIGISLAMWIINLVS